MSSVGGLGQSIIQYLQNLNSNPLASQTATASDASIVQDADGDGDGSTQGVGGGHYHHHGGGEFFQQIQSAVTSALQSAQSSDLSSDPNQVIQNAIAQVIKLYQSGANSTADQTASNGTPSPADGKGPAANGAFAQLLQSNGVDPQQFQQDFLSAIQSAQSGQSADAASVFSSFPSGSAVDTVA